MNNNENSGFRTTRTQTQLAGEYKLVQPHSWWEYKLVIHFNTELKIYTPFNVENYFRYTLEYTRIHINIQEYLQQFVTTKNLKKGVHVQ